MIISRNFINYMVIFGLSFLIASISWDNLRNIISIDRDNYYEYFSFGVDRLTYIEFDNIVDYVKNEWFWHYSIRHIATFLDVKLIFSFITFLSFFVYALYIYKKTHILFMFLLFNPLFFDLIYSQLRISLASTFFIISILLVNKNKFLFLLFLLLSFTTHTAIFPISLIYLISYFLSKIDIDEKIKIFISLIVGFIFSFIMGPFLNIFLNFVGDRRLGYDTSALSSSFLYLSFWFLMFLFLLLQCKNKSFIRNINDPDNFFAISILSFVFMSFFVGGYSTRIIAISLSFLIILIFKFFKFFKLFIIYFYFLYLLLYFYIWW